MNIKRIPVIISDMRENMLFSKKWVYTAYLHCTQYLSGVLHLICLLPFLRFRHPVLFLCCFITPAQADQPPIPFQLQLELVYYSVLFNFQ